MSYLIDSDWVVDYLKEQPQAVRLIDDLIAQGMRVGISLITYGEVYDGIYAGQRSERAEAGFRRLLQSCGVLGLNRAIMRRFARIRGELRREGQRIGDPDILIAATALHNDLALVTRNVQHFGRIPGLRLYQLDPDPAPGAEES